MNCTNNSELEAIMSRTRFTSQSDLPDQPILPRIEGETKMHFFLVNEEGEYEYKECPIPDFSSGYWNELISVCLLKEKPSDNLQKYLEHVLFSYLHLKVKTSHPLASREYNHCAGENKTPHSEGGEKDGTDSAWAGMRGTKHGAKAPGAQVLLETAEEIAFLSHLDVELIERAVEKYVANPVRGKPGRRSKDDEWEDLTPHVFLQLYYWMHGDANAWPEDIFQRYRQKVITSLAGWSLKTWIPLKVWQYVFKQRGLSDNWEWQIDVMGGPFEKFDGELTFNTTNEEILWAVDKMKNWYQ